MQKVEGSSPFIRLKESPATAGLSRTRREGARGLSPGTFSREEISGCQLGLLARKRVAEIEGCRDRLDQRPAEDETLLAIKAIWGDRSRETRLT